MSRRGSVPPDKSAPCEIVAVTSGKGGVGKSTLTLNLALALALKNFRVLVIDADIGTANLDILLNLDPRYHLAHVISGRVGLRQILQKVTENLSILPGASGISELPEMSLPHRDRLRRELDRLEATFDYLFVDTSAGVGRSVIQVLRGADRVILVCNEEPTAIVDAYALCKVFYQEQTEGVIELVVNNIHSEEEALEVYGKLRMVD